MAQNENILQRLGKLFQSNIIIRKDDEPETVKDRLKVYWTQTQPLIEYYSNFKNASDFKYLTVDGTLTVEEIKNNIKDFLSQ